MQLNELNWKTWGLILVLAVGGAFEMIKRLPSGRSLLDASLRTISDSNETPYSVRRSRVALMERRRQAPALLPASQVPQLKRTQPAMVTPPPMTPEQLAALVAKQQNEKKLEAGTDGWEEVIDPKTGKKVKRKKKKKKVVKKDKPKAEDVADNKYKEASDSDSEYDSSESAIDAAISRAIVTGELTPPPPNKPDEPFEGADEWARRLLSRPNLAETNRFIDHYKRNLVTSDVYYKVVRLMIEDSRPEMKKLGILAASQVYTPVSFQILAKVLQSNADASVKEKAQEALKAYETFARLNILEKILVSSSSGYNTVLAAQKLQISAETIFKPSASSTSTAPTQTASEVVRARQVTAYSKFVPILTKLTQSQDQAVKDQATQTLSTLQSLLGSTTAATQPDPQPAS